MKRKSHVILQESFKSLHTLVDTKNCIDKINEIKEVISNLQQELILEITRKENPYTKLQLNIKIDILKNLKVKYCDDVFCELTNELIFPSLIVDKSPSKIQKNAYFIKCNFLSNYEFCNLKFLDINLKNKENLLELSNLKFLIGLKISFMFEFCDECLESINTIMSLKFLYINGVINASKNLTLYHLELLKLYNTKDVFELNPNLIIKDVNLRNIEISNQTLSNILKLKHLRGLVFINCILPQNILSVFEGKIRCLKIVDCKSSFKYKLSKNYFLQKIHIEKFDFTIQNMEKKDDNLVRKKFKEALKKYLKNTKPINFYFQIDY